MTWVRASTPGLVDGTRKGIRRAVPRITMGTPLYAVHLKLPVLLMTNATRGLKVEDASENELTMYPAWSMGCLCTTKMYE